MIGRLEPALLKLPIAEIPTDMERELIDYLRQRLPSHPCLRLGIGDDAAVLQLAPSKLTQKGQVVVTVDLLTDLVDFHLDQVDPRRIGHKALAVNLSDIAAMAARPIAAVVALALPRTIKLSLVKALYEGMIPLAERHNTVIAGGDTNSYDGPLAISITLLGETTEHGVLTRSGAIPGDHILVTGRFGGSILGHHLDFEPRVNEALQLAAGYDLHAAMDVSDSLSLDLSRMATASGCGAVLEDRAIPIAQAAHNLATDLDDGRSALDHAYSDGEDFELLFAAPPEVAQQIIADQPLENLEITRIGCFIEPQGLYHETLSGTRQPMQPRGWQHEFEK